MKERLVAALCCVLMGFIFLVAGQQVAVADEKASSFRIVTDLQGNRVRLPLAKELRRVVIIAPPLLSTFASLRISQAEVVGTHKIAFDDANKKLLNMLLPGWQHIPTGFLTGFQANTEELLKLKPDIILVYGKFQKEGLQGIHIPVLDFFINNQDNEVWSVAIETLMREIFAVGEKVPPLQEEWDKVKKQAAELFAKRKSPPKKGLMLMANTGDKITVRGIGSYGDDWLKKSGLENAANIEGDGREVSMEQIYSWNPDVIYVFRGIPASKYLNGSIAGQDWHHTNAVKNGAVYDMPLGLMNWGAPNADSPLTLLWLISKNYPELLNDDNFQGLMKGFYIRRYGVELDAQAMNAILYPHGK